MLIFSVSYKEPAHAAAVVAPVIDTAIEIALAALGITVAGSVPDTTYKQIIQNIKTQAVIDSFGFVTAGQGVYNLGSQFLKSVGDSFMSWYNSIGSDWSGLSGLKVPLSASGLNIGFGSLGTTLQFQHRIYWDAYSLPSSSNGNIVGYTFLKAIPRYSDHSKITTVSAPNWTKYYRLDGSNQLVTNFDESDYSNFSTYSVITYSSMSLTQMAYLVALQFANGSIEYLMLADTPYEADNSFPNARMISWDNSHTTPLPISPSSADLEMKLKMIADGISILNNSVDEVISRLNKIVGVLNPDGSVSIPANIPKGAENDTSKARDTDQEKVVGQTVATDADRAADDATNADRDTTLPKPSIPDLTLPEVIFKEKFPFCLPWDLYTAFSNLQAPPQPPKWEVPFKIQSINYEQNISIDFSQFSTLASILRWGLSVLFIIFLILLTRQIIGQ